MSTPHRLLANTLAVNPFHVSQRVVAPGLRSELTGYCDLVRTEARLRLRASFSGADGTVEADTVLSEGRLLLGGRRPADFPQPGARWLAALDAEAPLSVLHGLLLLFGTIEWRHERNDPRADALVSRDEAIRAVPEHWRGALSGADAAIGALLPRELLLRLVVDPGRERLRGYSLGSERRGYRERCAFEPTQRRRPGAGAEREPWLLMTGPPGPPGWDEGAELGEPRR